VPLTPAATHILAHIVGQLAGAEGNRRRAGYKSATRLRVGIAFDLKA